MPKGFASDPESLHHTNMATVSNYRLVFTNLQRHRILDVGKVSVVNFVFVVSFFFGANFMVLLLRNVT